MYADISVLQGIAGYCRVLQGIAGCCRVLQGVAVCCSVLQCVAVCCSVLQCVAVFAFMYADIHGWSVEGLKWLSYVCYVCVCVW